MILPLQGIPTTVEGAVTQYSDVLISVGSTVILFIVSFLLIYRIGRTVLVRATKRVLNAREFSSAVVSLGSSIAGVIALFTAVAIAAAVAGFPTILSAFATIAGALSLGLSFASRDILENFVAGIFILKDKPFTVGDYIEWDGNEGIVREIDLRVSKLDTYNNEQITVPNSDLANAVVTNPVANDMRRVPVDFGIEYEADIDRARQIITEEAATITGVLADPAPTAPVTELADSAVVLNGRAWIDPTETTAIALKTTWVEAVKKRFDAEGVGMPYPHTEFSGSMTIDGINTSTTDSMSFD